MLRKVIRNSIKIFFYLKDYVLDSDVKNSLEMGYDFEGENVELIFYLKSVRF